MIVHLRRRRYRYRAILGKETHLIMGRGSGVFKPRGVVFLVPVRKQLVDRRRFDDIPGYNMVAQLAGFLKDEDPEVFIACFVG